ncbi:hypothetical protein ACFLZ4_01320 [Patescibacteria group bacterium]
MVNLLIDNIYNTVLVVISLLFLLFLLFPLEKSLSKVLKIKMSKAQILLIFSLIIVLVIIISDPLSSFITFFMIMFSFLVFLFGFLSNRKYVYISALIALGLIPFAFILGIDKLAEFLAQIGYFFLVLGVLKDVFYEKVFE